jgi:hypothetical protein
MSEWVPIVSTIGIPACIILFAGVCIRQASPWVADKVILPFVNRGLALIDALLVSIEEQNVAMKTIGEAVKGQSETMKTVGVTMVKMAMALERSASKVADAAVNIDSSSNGNKDHTSG